MRDIKCPAEESEAWSYSREVVKEKKNRFDLASLTTGKKRKI